MTNLIGISGKIGSGKDTVGNILCYLNSKSYKDGLKFVNEDGYNTQPYQIKKFAGKLKDIACLLIGCSREQLEDRKFKEAPLGEQWNHWVVTSSYGAPDEIYFEDPGMVHSQKRQMTPRLMLQLLGTEAGRRIIHPNIWVNALFAHYKPVKDKLLEGEVRKVREEDLVYPNWIITDVRFPNEVKSIKERGGIVIRVNRDKFSYQSDLPASASPIEHAEKGKELHYHPSETALDDYEFDYVLENNGSIEELVQKIKQLNLV